MYQNSDMKKTFGQRVRDERKLLKLTQTELAKQGGMSQGNLSDIENDAVPTSTYTPALAKAFHVNAHWLATGIGARDGNDNVVLPRKSPEPLAHNLSASKALLDLARELERGDLPPDVEAMLKAELDAKSKAVRALLSRLLKETPKS